MKAKNRKRFNAFLAVSFSVASFTGAMANEEKYLNSDPININGYVQEQVAPTDAELETVKNELQKQKNAIVINKEKKKKYGELSESTEKLADVTEDMIEERKESQNTIDKFNKKIDCLMAEGQKPGCEEFVKQDKVAMKQAAPQVVEATVQAPSTGDNFGESIKVLPYSGLTTFFSKNEQLEAGLVGGIKLETNATNRFSVGIGFKYTNLTTQDYAGVGGLGSYMNPGYLGYYNTYYGGRDIEYSNMNFDIYSKFFFLKNNRFRPYVGAGLGYNRTSLEYANNNSANPYHANVNYGYSFGNEEVNTSSINAELMLGSEVKFTDSIGAVVELNYTRAFGGNISSDRRNYTYYAPDQLRLEDLSAELNEANVVSLFASMLIEF